jgi:alkaline phosphatase D
VKTTRRDFLALSAATASLTVVAPLERLLPAAAAQARRVFRHGVASGDPLTDRVILWTRISGAAATARPAVDWQLAADQSFKQIAARGVVHTDASRDFTVKIDAGGLQAGRTYYYRFESGGERSMVGRTRTLPDRDVRRIRLAIASCSNMPFGYFNAYRGIGRRADLDAVLHLGDYIYEYENGRYGDGTKFGRIPQPNREIITLEDYRTRHAQYKTDVDLQEAHRQHPWIVVWDDHEFANNTWRDGALNHQPEKGEGDWSTRRRAAIRAYFEWMPIRKDGAVRQSRIYRTFSFGSLADLVMLDTRVIGRDQEAPKREDLALIERPDRSMLGHAQEAWLFSELAQSKADGVRWQLIGQQVMFAPMAPWGQPSPNKDAWDGYRPARNRLIDFLRERELRNAVILTGDLHSSWAYDVSRDPWSDYDPQTGRGTVAVEFITPAITSPSGWGDGAKAAEYLRTQMTSRPHLKWAEGLSRGYLVLDVTADAVQADWFFVPTVETRTADETFAKGFSSAWGQPGLVVAQAPARPPALAQEMANGE